MCSMGIQKLSKFTSVQCACSVEDIRFISSFISQRVFPRADNDTFSVCENYFTFAPASAFLPTKFAIRPPLRETLLRERWDKLKWPQFVAFACFFQVNVLCRESGMVSSILLSDRNDALRSDVNFTIYPFVGRQVSAVDLNSCLLNCSANWKDLPA